METLGVIGVLKGHRRGIWCVQFSPVDEILATASADADIKIWSLNDYSTLKVRIFYLILQLFVCGIYFYIV